MALSLADRVVLVTPEVFPDPNIPWLCATLDRKCQSGGLAESDTGGQHGHSSGCTHQILPWKNELLRTANGLCSHVPASDLAWNRLPALLQLLIRCIPKPQDWKRHKGGYGMKTHPKTILKMRLELKERCTEEAKSWKTARITQTRWVCLHFRIIRKIKELSRHSWEGGIINGKVGV